jgi:hypothetical protein
MNDEVMKETSKLMKYFSKSFINMHMELILDDETNLYFRLAEINDPIEITYKILEWVSRSCIKGVSGYKQKQYRNALNNFFNKEITELEWYYVYTYLGNNCNRKLCETYVASGMDINSLKSHEFKKYGNYCTEEWYNKYFN